MDKNEEIVKKMRDFSFFCSIWQGFFSRACKAESYAVTEGAVLYALYRSKSMTSGEIVSCISLDKGYISRTVGDFKNRGLLLRTTSGEDRRRHIVKLTEKGRAEIERIIRSADKMIMEEMEKLSAEDRLSLFENLSGVMKYFSSDE